MLVEADLPTGTRAIRDAVAEILTDGPVSRIVVVPVSATGSDPLFSQVLAVLMLLERLDVEVAVIAPAPTPATRIYGLPHGSAARELAETGAARELPLIRDDAATVLVGRARHLGDDGARLHGETYVDSELLFTGEARGVEIEPLPVAPGVRARLIRRFPAGRWLTGRAVQTGGTNIVVEREGTLTPRVVKRSTFYRHHVDMKVVTP